jgi:hypothetical protein
MMVNYSDSIARICLQTNKGLVQLDSSRRITKMGGYPIQRMVKCVTNRKRKRRRPLQSSFRGSTVYWKTVYPVRAVAPHQSCCVAGQPNRCRAPEQSLMQWLEPPYRRLLSEAGSWNVSYPHPLAAACVVASQMSMRWLTSA